MISPCCDHGTDHNVTTPPDGFVSIAVPLGSIVGAALKSSTVEPLPVLLEHRHTGAGVAGRDHRLPVPVEHQIAGV